MRLLLAITGASGVQLGFKALELLPPDVTPYLILSDHAETVRRHERAKVFEDSDIAAPVASGSFPIDAMMVAPCSMNTLAKIACGIADNLVTRAAAVAIKERRTLLLAPREMPFSPIALENMLKLSRLGVVIAPPVMGYYAEHDSVEAMERFVVGKWFDMLGIGHDLYQRWRIEEA
ncbi:UbiX family flavin prenyltransferase [Hydrogenimonas sp.]